MKTWLIVVSIIAVLLAASTGVGFWMLNDTKAELASTEAELASTEAELTDTEAELTEIIEECATPGPSPTPTQFKTYSKYGFSFEYPKTFSVTEMGILESEANDNSGMVQVWVENEEIESFQVGWVKMMPDIVEIGPGGLEGNLKDSLEGGFAAMESTEGIASVEEGELVEATKAGHLMLYQYYTITVTEGDKAYGIAGGFYCDESLKLFSLSTMNATISAKKDVLEDFQNYLDSFVCH